MSLWLKGLGVSFITALAMSAVAILPAQAEVGGHLVSSHQHVEIVGVDLPSEPPTFGAFGQSIACHESSYASTLSSATKTWTELTVTPTYHDCTSAISPDIDVKMNGCDYVFTIKRTNPATSDNTIHLVCPGSEGPVIETTPGVDERCILTITPNLTPTGGITYTDIIEGANPPQITFDSTVTGVHFVRTTGGFFDCGTFSSTDANGSLGGKVVAIGFDTGTNRVQITATGS